MKYGTLCALAAACLLGGAGHARAELVVIDFNNLKGQKSVPHGYANIDWLSSWTHYGWEQPPYTAHSTPVRVYGNLGRKETTFAFLSPNQFFLGAWFAGQDNITVEFRLFNDGKLVHTTAALKLTGTPHFLAAQYAGPVDAVGVRTNGPGFWVMDDLTYHRVAAHAPEPSSLALLALGAAGATGYWWRRGRRAT